MSAWADISFAAGRPNQLSAIEWRDTWMAAIGFGYKVTAATELTAGMSDDTRASTDGSGTTLSPDGEKILIGLGLVHQFPGASKGSLSYGHLFFMDAPYLPPAPATGVSQAQLKHAWIPSVSAILKTGRSLRPVHSHQWGNWF
jgi:long-subunit fatty acid transport protein